MTSHKQKILFVWTGVTSYMGDCWRRLSACADVELKVVIADRSGGYGTAFQNEKVMRGVDWRLQTDACAMAVLDDGWKPDIAFVVGWRDPICRAYAQDARLRNVPKICCFDMPWEWRLRKFAARFVLASYLRNFSAAFVPGEVAARYARWLGFSDRRVYRGLFGVDVGRFLPRAASGGFLFVGRLSNEKRIDVLATAYRAYRRAVADPWGLDVYGIGAREPWLRGIPGVVLHGFAQPDELPRAYACAQALVLPSAWDPWPLVIAESCAAGAPVICTDRCWNVPELVKANGSVVRSGDARALTAAMLKVSSLDGSVGKRLIADYSCEKWVERVRRIINDTGASAC